MAENTRTSDQDVNSLSQEDGTGAVDQWSAHSIELLNPSPAASMNTSSAPAPPTPMNIAAPTYQQYPAQHQHHYQHQFVQSQQHGAPIAAAIPLVQHHHHQIIHALHLPALPTAIPYHPTNAHHQGVHIQQQQPLPQNWVADPMAPNNPIISNNTNAIDFSQFHENIGGIGLPEEATDANNAVNESRNVSEGNSAVQESQVHATYNAPHNQLVGRKPRKDFCHRLKEIKDFKLKFGHTMIPHKYTPNPSLGTWIDTQRRRYRKVMTAEKKFYDANPQGDQKKYEEFLAKTGPHIKPDHISQLVEIGFVFEPRLSRKETWEKRVEELEIFKEQYGHCNVREDDMLYPGLGKWVSYVRRTFRLAKKKGGKGSKLTVGKIEELNKMGFVFELKEELAIRRFKAGLSDLQKFHESEGHCRVPNFYVQNPTFGLCVEDMRSEYRKICDNVTENGGEAFSDIMEADLVEELSKLGFLLEEGISPFPSLAETQDNDQETTEADDGDMKPAGDNSRVKQDEDVAGYEV